MDIDDTPIFKEIKEIIDDGPKPVYYQYKAKIHVNGDEYEAVKVVSVDIVSDYQNKTGDVVILKAIIPLGLWAKKMYKYRTELEISLIKIPLQESSDETMTDEEIEVQKYLAIPDTDTIPVLAAKDIDNYSMEELDLFDLPTITFQLTDKLLYKLRLISVGGVFRRTTPLEIVKYVLTTETSKIKVDDDYSYQGLDYIKSNNDEAREHTIIPQGTNIVDVPVYLQRRGGGIYNSGIGSYYTKRHWFIYPLYDTTRLQDSTKTLTIIKAPALRTKSIERTYRTEGDTTYILGTDRSGLIDDSGAQFTVSGNGTRFTDSRKHIRDFTEVAGNKSIASRTKSNHEFVIVDKENEKNAVFQSSRKTNSNPYVERSELAGKNGAVFKVIWENADFTVLYPAMMCKIIYLDNNEVKEIHGCLLGVETAIQLQGIGLTARKHITTISLYVFVQRNEDDETEDSGENDDSDNETNKWVDYVSI